ncbi:MAG: J domain-containing protein [Pseudomonadota bacterium]|nr:J domain-containing protein [Pseudomonadota bacterium]
MFDRSSQPRHKNLMRVRLALAGSEPFEAAVFLKLEERLIDLLNDPRAFIPVRRHDGMTMMIAKANIVSVTEIPDLSAAGPEVFSGDDEAVAERRQRRTSDEMSGRGERRPRPRRVDPYEVLRVARDASTDEVKRAYKARIKAVHPDAIASLDLDEDLARAANLTTQKVNQAYDMIMRERQQTEEPKASEAAADQA